MAQAQDGEAGEILEAALGVFAETGFAAAKLTEIARRAGVSKAALYLYFETKEDLFRAVARGLVTPNLTAMAEALEASETPFAQLAPALLSGAAGLLADGRAFSIGRMVIAESRNFPDLARIWREDVVEQVLGLIGGLIARAQARGEVIAGDPRLFAFSLAGPLVMGGLFHAVFGSEGTGAPDLPALAAQHARAALHGLLTQTPKETTP
ncbi:MAG: TetR/AcrR family transcriptional regulator [Caulobacteraceae bacterium]